MARMLAAALVAFTLCAPACAATVTAFAAASLKESLDEASRAFEVATGHKARVSYGASSALARQIEAGAPAEIFICADADWMDYLAARHLVESPARVLVLNAIVLVAPAGQVPPLHITDAFPLAKALGAGRLALADPRSVPAGKYARAALEHFHVWESVRDRIAPAENVRAALALVARGETPLGIVYATDAKAEPRVVIVDTFPGASHPAIVYPLALVPGAPSAARDYAQFLASAAARDIFRRHGFTLP